jgi:hypothetical protein
MFEQLDNIIEPCPLLLPAEDRPTMCMESAASCLDSAIDNQSAESMHNHIIEEPNQKRTIYEEPEAKGELSEESGKGVKPLRKTQIEE